MPVRLIDFHSHYLEPSWVTSLPAPGTPLAGAWPLLTDLPAQRAALAAASIDAKVLTAPPSMLVAPGAPLPAGMIARVNDQFATLVADSDGALLGLATIDAFQGDVAASEVVRAVQVLGFRGIVVDCAQGDLFLDAPVARPTLEAAAALGATVFVHPVSPAGLTERLARLGHAGVLLARGTEDAASILALLHAGLFDDLPALTVVIPMIGAAALLFAGLAEQDAGREVGWGGSSPRATRQRLYVDTMGFDPAAIRWAVDMLGAEHVLLGSDWPIMPITPRAHVLATLTAARLTAAEQTAILGGNAQRLLTPLT